MSEHLREKPVQKIKPPVWFLESRTPTEKVREVRHVFREIDEKAFVKAWKTGVPIQKMREMFQLSHAALYYHAGRLQLPPRMRALGNTSKVSTEGRFTLPMLICRQLNLSAGEFYEVEVLSEESMTLQLKKMK